MYQADRYMVNRYVTDRYQVDRYSTNKYMVDRYKKADRRAEGCFE